MNGSYMAAHCSANQEPLAKLGIVPLCRSRHMGTTMALTNDRSLGILFELQCFDWHSVKVNRPSCLHTDRVLHRTDGVT